MKLRSHLGKITWSLADKGLYVLYGLVQLWQIQALAPNVYGVFALLVALNTWIMLISDGSALNGLIQFGTDPTERKRINAMGLVIHATVLAVSSLLVLALQQPLSDLFREKQFVKVATMLPLYCLLTLPRMFCLKLIYREMRMRDLFIIDLIWFLVRTIMTAWAINTDSLHTLEDIIQIDFAGMAASSLGALYFTRKELRFNWKGSITFRDYLRYGIPMAVAGALNSTPRQLDVLVIAAFFGVGVVGVYNLAKNLYRFFEQAFDAVVSLLYPASVRMITQHRTEDLQILVTKAISVTLIPTVIALVILELGGSSLIVPLLGEKYSASVGHFNILILAALGMPFTLMSSIIQAMGHSTVVVKFSAIGLVVGMSTLFVTAFLGLQNYIGLGLVANSIVVGLLCTAYVRKSVHFPLNALMRAVQDVRKAVINKFQAS
ncbi:MAG: oligosaccharide flippase family protein [Ignavibacteria bacterium]|nr:oligosaccharide flippase family protein [Ignavibacteria bacterium]